ncbi:MAG TPA: hypothetical protein V6D14_34040 [Coleofasciculaceae cyanobacterium]
MTGKVIDRSATGLILILPFAFLCVLLFKAWPALLALFVFMISFRIWQQYQWKQWTKQVNPFFNELIRENQGCLTPMDLSLKANLSGPDAQWYLEKKAEEFGAQRRDYEGKGTVYYFLTASALGSIFEDSEPPPELESESLITQSLTLPEPLIDKESLPSPEDSEPSPELESEPLITQSPTLPEPLIDKESLPSPEDSEPPPELESESLITQSPTLPEPLIDKESLPSPDEASTSEPPKPLEASEQQQPSLSDSALSTAEKEVALEPPPQPKQEQTEAFNETEDLWADSPEKEQKTSQALIQAELAKRLDVHTSTVGKRKSDPDFPEWSQSRDPEGMAWVYSPETKEFFPTENPPQFEE